MDNEYIIEQIKRLSEERKQSVEETVSELSKKIAVLYAQQNMEGTFYKNVFTEGKNSNCKNDE